MRAEQPECAGGLVENGARIAAGIAGGVPHDLLRAPSEVAILAGREDITLLDGGRGNGGGAEHEESEEDFAMEHGRMCGEESKLA